MGELPTCIQQLFIADGHTPGPCHALGSLAASKTDDVLSPRLHGHRQFPGASWQLLQWLPESHRGRRRHLQISGDCPNHNATDCFHGPGVGLRNLNFNTLPRQSGFGTTRLGSCSWGSETWRDSLSSTRRENVFNTHPWAKHLLILRQILSLHHVPCNVLGLRNTAEIRQYSSCSKGLTVVLVGVGSGKKAKKERNQII